MEKMNEIFVGVKRSVILRRKYRICVKSIIIGMVLTISSKELCSEIIVMIQSTFSRTVLKRRCRAFSVV